MWRRRHAVREAVLNVGTRGVLVAFLAFGLCFAASQFEGNRIAELRSAITELENDGIDVVIVETDAFRLSSSRCESISRWGGVRASGSLTTSGAGVELQRFARAPGSDVQEAIATVGLLQVLNSRPPVAGETLFGEQVAAFLGAQNGQILTTADRAQQYELLRLAENSRTELLGSRLIRIVPPSEPASTCWVEFEPADSEVNAAAVAGSFGVPAVGRPLLRASRGQLRQEFADTSSSSVVVSLAGTFGLLMFVLWRSRKAELGLYLALGMDRVTLMLCGSVNGLMTVVPGAVTGWAFSLGTLVVSHRTDLDAELLLHTGWPVAVICASGWIADILSPALLATADPIRLLKE